MKLSVIILALTTSKELYQMTSDCVNSLFLSQSNMKIEVIIIESNKNYAATEWQYPSVVKVIIPDSDFNFHKFLNIGIRASKGEFIALCNNDLIFHANWFTEILHVKNTNPELKSFSPNETIFTKQTEKSFIVGFKIRHQLKGWCIVVERNIFEKLGQLDESFDFYFADNDYAMSLRVNNLKHALVCKSYVEHLEKRSSKEILKEDDENKDFLNKYKIPKYLLKKNFSYILENEKNISGFLKFHLKWGNPTSIYRKNKIADYLFYYNLGYFVRFMYYPKKNVTIYKNY